jgi:hypothetical protein
MLRRLFGLERGEVIGGGWIKLHEEELNLYFSANMIRVIKSRTMR